jgi:hypothetical protein
MDLQEILDDLQTVFPSEIEITSPPYAQDMDLEEKFNREILANLTSTKDHYKYKQELTLHYATIAEYTK